MARKMTMDNEQHPFEDVFTKTGIGPEMQAVIERGFGKAFSEASAHVSAASRIRVKGETDTASMTAARGLYGALRGVRLQVEATRKQLKDESLKTGQAIDGAARKVRDMICPVEEAMQAAAEYAKRLQEAREEALESKRREVLDKLEWESNSYDLRTMPEDQFDRVVAVAKERHAELLVAKERDRLERMEAAERLRLENEELRKVAERESKLRREAEAREAEQRSKALQEAAERASVVARGERQREAEQSRLAAATDAERALAYVTALQAVAIPMIANYEVSSVVLQLAASIDAAEGVLRKLKGERLV